MFRAIFVLGARGLNSLVNKGAAKTDAGIFWPPTMEDFGEPPSS